MMDLADDAVGAKPAGRGHSAGCPLKWQFNRTQTTVVSAGIRLHQDERLGGLPTAVGIDLRPNNSPRTTSHMALLFGGVPTAAAEVPRPAGGR
jgi:hypothetical protein